MRLDTTSRYRAEQSSARSWRSVLSCAASCVLLALAGGAAGQTPPPASPAQGEWLTFDGVAVENGDTYLLLNWDAKAGIEFKKGDVSIAKSTVKVRAGSRATRIILPDGTVERATLSAPTDGNTMCIFGWEICCGTLTQAGHCPARHPCPWRFNPICAGNPPPKAK